MKICGRCKRNLKESNFHKRGEGLQSICKSCRKEDDKHQYSSNGKKEKLIEQQDRNRKIVNEIKNNSKCKYCIENDPVTFDFHHRNPEEKEFIIAYMMNQNTERLLKEINKCDIICANCHRKLHAGRTMPN